MDTTFDWWKPQKEKKWQSSNYEKTYTNSTSLTDLFWFILTEFSKLWTNIFCESDIQREFQTRYITQNQLFLPSN